MSASVFPSTESFSEERFKKLVAFLIALVTVLIAVVTYLQSDAGARDDRANRDTKRYSMEAMGRQVSGDARVNYDYNRAYQAYYEYDLLAVAASNAGDDSAAARYEALRDEMIGLSPMLAPPYFDPETGELNIAKYEADTYVVETTGLMERFAAASAVKDAWDYKSNIYIVHLTLLAVALFLYGLSATISGPATRWVFAGVGTVIAVVGAGWALAVFLKAVPDLRECRTEDGVYAIDAYADGVGLAYQDEYEQAIEAFDSALDCHPKYANALAERAAAYAALGDYPAAIADYEAARAAGQNAGYIAGDLAWLYYLSDRFDDAAAMNRIALQSSPDELWIQFDLALSLLASGHMDEARAEYAKGMDLAARLVAEAKAAGQEPPSHLWWGLDDAAESLDDLILVLDTGEGEPAADAIADPDAARAAAEELLTQLKSLAVALEFTGAPPAGALEAAVNEFTFGLPVYDDAGELLDYDVADSFPYGIDEVSVLFDYDGMRDGQEVVFKVYVDGEEDPSWRVVAPWDLGESGSAERTLSLAYSDSQVLDAGEYVVEVYVDSHLAQRGVFYVEE